MVACGFFLGDIWQGLEIHQMVVQPLPIWACLGYRLLKFFVADDATFLGIDQEHAPRLQPLLDEHAFRRHIEHANL